MTPEEARKLRLTRIELNHAQLFQNIVSTINKFLIGNIGEYPVQVEIRDSKFNVEEEENIYIALTLINDFYFTHGWDVSTEISNTEGFNIQVTLKPKN